ncbi:hypothetical protein BC828DRAFT_402947 [Blastocladiella britannica]|nr:hypothetical protein BC828DRAFT_402947 [Blastocladiella britannica]
MSLHHGDVAALVLEHAASQSMSLSEAITSLLVLPAAEQPEARAVVLARGYVDPVLAVALGHAHLLPDFPKWLHLDKTRCGKIMFALAAVGDVDALNGFFSYMEMAGPVGPMARGHRFSPAVLMLIEASFSSGHVPVFESLVATVAQRGWETPFDGGRARWIMAARAGHISVLDWALREQYLHLDEFTLELRAAAAAGQLSVLEWFHAQKIRCGYWSYRDWDSNSIARGATEGRGNHLRVLEWWWANVVSIPRSLPPLVEFNEMVGHALFVGNYDVVLWWWSKFEAHRTPQHRFGARTAAVCALAGGSLPVIQWLWSIAARPDASEILTGWDPNPMFSIPNGRLVESLPLVQWWIDTQLPPGTPLEWKPSHSETAAKAGAVDVLDFVLALPDQSFVTWGDMLADTAVQYHQLHVLEWYFANRTHLPERQHPFSFDDMPKDYSSMDAIVWWESHIGFDDQSFQELSGAIARQCDCDAIYWWISVLAKPSRKHLVRAALTKALVAACSVWALDLLTTAADGYGLVTASDLMANHTCNAGNSVIGQHVAQNYAHDVQVVRSQVHCPPTDLAALVAAHHKWTVCLALNAVGAADELIAVLDVSSTLVTYGTMIPALLTVSLGLFVVRTLMLKGVLARA